MIYPESFKMPLKIQIAVAYRIKANPDKMDWLLSF
jgi:hypothetical protein